MHGAIFCPPIPGRKKAASFEAAFHQTCSIFPICYMKIFIRLEQSTDLEFPNPAYHHGTILFCVPDSQISVSF